MFILTLHVASDCYNTCAKALPSREKQASNLRVATRTIERGGALALGYMQYERCRRRLGCAWHLKMAMQIIDTLTISYSDRQIYIKICICKRAIKS